MNINSTLDIKTCCDKMPEPQEKFTLEFTLDITGNGRVVRLEVGANRLASVVEQLSKRFYITIE